MKKSLAALVSCSGILGLSLLAQGPGGPGGQGPGGGFGPPGMGATRKVIKDYDKDGDGKLNLEERKAAREGMKKEQANRGPGGRGFGGPGGPGGRPNFSKLLLDALDIDKDASVSKEELAAGVKTFFADKSSFTTQQLAERFTQIMPAMGGRPGGGFGPGGPGGGPGGSPPGEGGQGKDQPPPKDGAGAPPGKSGFGFGGSAPNKGGGQGKDQPPAKDGAGVPPGKSDFGFGGSPPNKGGGQGKDQPPGKQGGGMGIPFSPGNMIANTLFPEADKNKDGKVTIEEANQYVSEKFTTADKDKNGKLNETELATAIPMPQGGPGGRVEPSKPGIKISPSEAKNYGKEDLYDPKVLRTIFLTFEAKDWENEMSDFYHTDVEIPAKALVDGKEYKDVGVHFRGASSYFTVPAGSKRSLNLSFDFGDSKQRLLGHKTLNLLNCHEDDTFMSTVLYSHIARQYIPAPKANFVRVVINGENWGVYTNVEQMDKDFLKENFKSTAGSRWKVKGSPGGGGGLDYIGDDIEAYKRRYEMKSNNDDKAWKQLANLCKVINQTPADKLEEALKPILDVDGLLWFLALDVALINCDGYWIRASDYSIYLDKNNKFHMIPHDMNEAFRQPMGPGMGGMGGGRGGPGGAGAAPAGGNNAKAEQPRRNPIDLDPLTGLDDARKPLRSKILAVPKFKEQYLRNLKTIAEKSLDWEKLGPVVNGYRNLIEKEIQIDSRKLSSFTEFQRTTSDKYEADTAGRRPSSMNLHAFADQRAKYLLAYPEIQKLTK